MGGSNDWLDDQPELKRTFAIWIRAVLLRQGKHTLVYPTINDSNELRMVLARVVAADIAQLEIWGDRVLDEPSHGEMFG